MGDSSYIELSAFLEKQSDDENGVRVVIASMNDAELTGLADTVKDLQRNFDQDRVEVIRKAIRERTEVLARTATVDFDVVGSDTTFGDQLRIATQC